jgi:hypothetical protein
MAESHPHFRRSPQSGTTVAIRPYGAQVADCLQDKRRERRADRKSSAGTPLLG